MSAAWIEQTTTCWDCKHYQDTPRRAGTPPWRVCVLKKGDRMTCGSFFPRTQKVTT